MGHDGAPGVCQLSPNQIKILFWRTEDQIEVEFMIDDLLAVEVKVAKKIESTDLRGLRVLKEEKLLRFYVCVSKDPVDRLNDGIHLLHWKTFARKLWNDDFS